MVLPLRIFPAYGLDNSLLTAVLLGLYIRFFFTEWLGWVFSGLVVPGYLAAVFLLRPASGVVISLEGLITFLIVRGLSSLLSLTKLGTPVFGRERFVWLVITSVGVRLLMEALVAPYCESILRARMGWDTADSFGLYGIGLVLVPLLANACWKPGLLRGSFQQLVCTGATYLLLRLLLATTNLCFATVAQSFEQMVAGFATSQNEYLLLLAGALLASRANLRFGWDTGGVMIVGLLSLGWFAPAKLLATLCEAMLIVLVATLFLRLPRIRDCNIEGPRKVVLLFTIGYAMKLGITALLGVLSPGFDAKQLFGIGYLLPSLLAVKICQRRNPALVLVPAFNLSLFGLGLGSLTGYGLLFAGTALQSLWNAGAATAAGDSCGAPVALLSALRLARVHSAELPPKSTPLHRTAQKWHAVLARIMQLQALTQKGWSDCAQLAAQIRPTELGLELRQGLSPAGRSYLVLREDTEALEAEQEFGLLAVAAKPSGGPVLFVSRPQDDLKDPTSLAALVDLLQADAVVLGGAAEAARKVAAKTSADDADRAGHLPLTVSALLGLPIAIRQSALAEPQLTGFIPASLQASLQSRLGPLLQGAAAGPIAELALPPKSEEALAAPLLPTVPHFATATAWLEGLVVSAPDSPGLVKTPATERLLAEVLRTLLRAPAAASVPVLLQSVLGDATEVGLAVAQIDEPRPYIGLSARGEALLIDPGSPTFSVLETVSHRPGILELSAALFALQGAHALLIAGAGSDAGDAKRFSRVALPILALSPQPPEVLVLQAQDAATPDCAIVMDSALAQPAMSPLGWPMLKRLQASLTSLGIRAEVHTQYDQNTPDPPSVSISFLRERKQGGFLTLRVGPRLRDSFRPAAFSTAEQLLFARLGVPVQKATLEQLMLDACTTPEARLQPVIPEDLLRDARAFATTRHPYLIERLRTRTKGSRLRLTVVTDERSEQAYLLFRSQRGAVASTLRPQATADVALSCSDDVIAGIRRAQLVSAASIAVEGESRATSWTGEKLGIEGRR
jgi:hypothetical protein